ncbi:adenosine deaminase, partial [Streptomyces sp. SID11233]|nr:adenosine deaminase [Streptomyces sp. SID11233]
PALVARLVREQIPLTLCPLSNVRLRGIDTMEQHPLRDMLDAGLKCTVNSDDPSYFGGYAQDNFDAVRTALGLTEDQERALARNSFEAAFLEDDEDLRAR